MTGCSQKTLPLVETTENPVHHVLCGALAQREATLQIQTLNKSAGVLMVFEKTSGRKVIEKEFTTVQDDNFLIKIPLTGILPDHLYTYTLSGKNKQTWWQGQFQTMPEGPSNYKVVIGSCQETGSESDIFGKILGENPLFYLQIGDIHYENIGHDCQKRFDSTYNVVFSSKAQSDLYRNVSFVYMWDDHDFGPNNSDASNPCREVAIRQYKNHFPHYPLAFDSDTSPISQVFEAGRVTFLLTDMRSQKIPPVVKECERTKAGTNFGSEAHLQWFFDRLLAAKTKGHVVAWVNSYPWINAPGGPNYKCSEKDNWGGYPEERTKIADFIKKHKIPVFILSGDAHMVAMDDGTNSDYATGGGAPVRVFHAAALDRPGSYKGGPYSQGYSREEGQYGVIEVTDDGGDNVCFTWYAKNVHGEVVKNQEGNEIRLDFCTEVGLLK